MNDYTLPETPAQNIPPAAPKRPGGDKLGLLSQRSALRRIADGPTGSEGLAVMEDLRHRLKQLAEHISSWEAGIEDARKWLVEGKGWRVTLLRLRKQAWSARALSPQWRARALKRINKVLANLEYDASRARDHIATWRAEIRWAKQDVRDWIVLWALTYQSMFPGRRAPNYPNLKAALGVETEAAWFPRMSIKRLVSIAKADIARTGGAERWRGAALLLLSPASPDPTIEPDIS